jgi:hypothetical protein
VEVNDENPNITLSLVGSLSDERDRASSVFKMTSKMGLSQQITMVVALLLALMASSEAFVPSSAIFPGTRSLSLNSQQTAFSYTASPNIKTTRTSSCSSLQMVSSGVTVAAGAITGAITGGLFSGSLHAISGE